jgi:hypothetical protein
MLQRWGFIVAGVETLRHSKKKPAESRMLAGVCHSRRHIHHNYANRSERRNITSLKSKFIALALLAPVSGLTGCGKSGFDTVHNCGNCTGQTFLFATDTAPNAILSYTVAASGAPAKLGTQSRPNQSLGLVADSPGSFLYVSDFQNSAVDAFTINSTSGALTPVAGSPSSVMQSIAPQLG